MFDTSRLSRTHNTTHQLLGIYNASNRRMSGIDVDNMIIKNDQHGTRGEMCEKKVKNMIQKLSCINRPPKELEVF